MLKIRKNKVKVVGVITFLSLLSISYVGLSFYSIPEKVSAADSNGVEEWRTLDDITYMQDMTIDICNNSEVGDWRVLIDTRGGGYENQGRQNSYVVQKLSDGNCWMGQNLRLPGGTRLTIADSDLNTGSFVSSGDDGDTVTSGNSYTLPASKESGFNDSTGHFVFDGNETQPYSHKYGSYYSWCATTAGCKNSNGGNPSEGKEAASSICPRGWKLPTSNKTNAVSGSFNNLVMDGSSQITPASAWRINQTDLTLGINIGVTSPTNGALFSGSFFPASGWFGSSINAISEVGIEGDYWSSTSHGNDAAYYVSLEANQIRPSNIWARYYGLSVRCVNNLNLHSTNVPARINAETSLSVHVGPTISIDAVSDLEGEVDYTKVLEDNITATVSSNNTYQLLLSAEQTSLLDATQPDNTGIPPVATTPTTPALPITAGTSAWGIYNGLDSDNTTKLYKAITTTPKIYYNTTVPTEDKLSTIHSFGIGIAVSPSIPNGTYSTSVTVTAVNA